MLSLHHTELWPHHTTPEGKRRQELRGKVDFFLLFLLSPSFFSSFSSGCGVCGVVCVVSFIFHCQPLWKRQQLLSGKAQTENGKWKWKNGRKKKMEKWKNGKMEKMEK